MTLKGIGWNFMFVAGSALVTKAYAPAERARTQAANDFLVFGTAAVTSLSSGQLLHHRGWQIVLVTAMVMLLAALAGSCWRAPRAASPTERSGLTAAD
jgi:MFS family permease